MSQKNNRFIVIWAQDAHELGWHKDCPGDWCDNINELYDTSTTPPTWIGADGGEPEDQTLTRQWDWVVEALNKYAK